MKTPNVPIVSPLAAILETERSLERELASARERAAAVVAQAHARAEAIEQEADRDGIAAADRLYQEGVAQATEQAAARDRQGEADAAALRRAGLAHMDAAIRHMLDYVLPDAGAAAKETRGVTPCSSR